MMPAHINKHHLAQIVYQWRGRKLAPKTMRQYIGALKRWCKWLGVPYQTYSTLPAIKAVKPRGTIVTRDTIEKLLAAAPMHLRLFILLCSDMCLRSGTAVRISAADYDAESRSLLFVTKANAVVKLPCTRRIVALIEDAMLYQGERDTPLVQRLGGPNTKWRGHAYWAQLNTLRRYLGVEHFRSHDLRRSQARRLYDQTRDLRVVQSALGHSNLASTFHYLYPHLAEVTAEQLERASLPPQQEEAATHD